MFSVHLCRVPPPHLSPFVDNEAEGYIPDYAQKIKQLQDAARIMPVPEVGNEHQDNTQNIVLDGVADRIEANKAAEMKKKVLAKKFVAYNWIYFQFTHCACNLELIVGIPFYKC